MLSSQSGEERGDGMMDVAPDRMLRPLYPDEVLIGVFTTFECNPWEALVPLVLVPLDEVPPLEKHLC